MTERRNGTRTSATPGSTTRPTPSRSLPTDRPQGIRVQKLLSRAGVASRRRAETLLVEGRVSVNGAVITELGTRVDPERDLVEVDGKPVRLGPRRWVLLNKPPGVLTTRSDPGGRPTVYDLLDAEDRELASVGRLDRDTEGPLLLTNDGDAAHRLLHPSSEIEREYLVDVTGVPDRRALGRLKRGVELDDGPARAKSVEITGRAPGQARLCLVIAEGRKREVRRMLEAVGHSVLGLARVRFGPQRLTGLASGATRALTAAEVRALHRAVGERPRTETQRRTRSRRRP